MKDIAIYGAGGLGREVACLLQAINHVTPQWNLVGFFDDGMEIGSVNEYGRILGGMSVLNNYPYNIAVVLAIGNPTILSKILGGITNKDLTFPNIIAPDVLFLDRNSVTMRHGNIVGFRSLISCNVHLGNFNIFNGDVFIGHDTEVGSFNVFNPSTRISGEVIIGDRNFFGVSSVVLQQKIIGNNVTVGANSVIIKKTADDTTYIGNPAIALKY
jgi:sugar O-acyltransferase (sialic acid O-acetyltransferase NeuD family)